VNEAKFWSTRVRPLLERAFHNLQHHIERVENAVAAGTPDVDYCVNGHAGKLELKYASRHPVNLRTTAVLGRDCGLRKSQVVWIHRRLRAGGTVFVAVGTPRVTWFVRARGLTPERLRGLALWSVEDLNEACCWRTGMSLDNLTDIFCA